MDEKEVIEEAEKLNIFGWVTFIFDKLLRLAFIYFVSVGLITFIFLYIGNNASLITYLKEINVNNIISFKQVLIEISLLIFLTIELIRLFEMGYLNYFPSMKRKIFQKNKVGKKRKFNTSLEELRNEYGGNRMSKMKNYEITIELIHDQTSVNFVISENEWNHIPERFEDTCNGSIIIGEDTPIIIPKREVKMIKARLIEE